MSDPKLPTPSIVQLSLSLLLSIGLSLGAQTSAPAEQIAAATTKGAKSLYYRQLVDDTKTVKNIGLTYSIELIRNGETAQVDSRYQFLSGDQLRFHVQSNIDGYLYIMLRHGSRGDSALLFPVADENNRIHAGKDVMVPGKGVLEFDEVAGTETVKLVLSKEKLLNDPASYSRSILITPKQSVDARAAECLIEFALKENSKVTVQNAEKQPQFEKEPAVTVVSTDVNKALSVEMDLYHGSKVTDATEAANKTASGSNPSSSRSTDAGLETRHVRALPVAESNIVGDKWAVLVGISDFKNPKWNLPYPAKDAQDLANFLTTEGHFAADHVKVLTNANATRENILSTIGSDWLPKNAKPNDLVLVYFATHGTAAEQDIAKKSFLVAYDTDLKNAFASGIEMQDLARTIKRRLNSNRIIIVLDTCHSGAAEPGAKALFPPASFSYEDLVQGTGQMVISSADFNEIAHDSMRYKNGIFTKHFIDGLRKNKKLDDAFAYTKSKVEEEAKQDFHQEQSPVMKDGEWKGSGVVLVVPPSRPSPAQK